MEKSIKGQLTLLLEEIHASQAVLSEKDWGNRTHVFSGRRCYELLARLNHVSLSMKMLPEQLLTGSWIKRSAIWQLRATPAGHPLLFLRVQQEQGTNGNGSGLLPTPLSNDWKGGTDQPRKDTGKLRLDQFRHWWKIVTGQPTPDPTFLEEYMGFPTGWTELGHLVTPFTHR
jgi:hypothetical protein